MTVRPARFLAVLATLLLAAPAAFAGEFVVIESPQELFAAGQVIAGSERITVPASVTLTVIGDDGEVLRLAGPFTGNLDTAAGRRSKAAGSEPSVVQTISRLLQTANPPEEKALLTVRGGIGTGGVKLAQPGVAIDIQRSGTYCVTPGSRPVLTRDEAAAFRTVVLTEAASGASATVPFAAFSTSEPWPEAVPLANGLTYRIGHAGDPVGQTFVLRAMPDGFPNDGRRIAWLAEHECADQAIKLLNTLTANAGGGR